MNTHMCVQAKVTRKFLTKKQTNLRSFNKFNATGICTALEKFMVSLAENHTCSRYGNTKYVNTKWMTLQDPFQTSLTEEELS